MLQDRWMVTEANVAYWGRLETKPLISCLQNQCSGMDVSNTHCSSVPLSPCADHISLPLIIFFEFPTLCFQGYSGSVAISWGFQDCLTGEGVLMGKRQRFIPWYLISKLIEMGCNNCVSVAGTYQTHRQV